MEHQNVQADRAMILVVDGDYGIRSLLVTLIHRIGFEADPAPSVDEALRRLESGPYSAVILETQMPDSDELLRLIATFDGDSQPKIIIASSGDGAAAMASGARIEAVLRKPFDINSLACVVAECCGLYDDDPAALHSGARRNA